MRFVCLLLVGLRASLIDWLRREAPMNPISRGDHPCEALEMPLISIDPMNYGVYKLDPNRRLESLFRFSSWSDLADTVCGDLAWALSRASGKEVKELVLKAKQMRGSTEWISASQLKAHLHEVYHPDMLAMRVGFVHFVPVPLSRSQVKQKQAMPLYQGHCRWLAVGPSVWVSDASGHRNIISLHWINARIDVFMNLHPPKTCGDLVKALSSLGEGRLLAGLPHTIEGMRSAIEDVSGRAGTMMLTSEPSLSVNPGGISFTCKYDGSMKYASGLEPVLLRSYDSEKGHKLCQSLAQLGMLIYTVL